jgi:hypothetical protein
MHNFQDTANLFVFVIRTAFVVAPLLFVAALYFGLHRVLAVAHKLAGRKEKHGVRRCTKCGLRPTARWCRSELDYPTRALCTVCYNNRPEIEIAQDAIDRSKEHLKTSSAALPILTPAEEIVEIVRQGGGYKCQICGQLGPLLAHDHDHSTGEFRGILCETCNKYRTAVSSRVGRLCNNPDAIDKLAKSEHPPAFVHESANYFRRVIARRNAKRAAQQPVAPPQESFDDSQSWALQSAEIFV